MSSAATIRHYAETGLRVVTLTRGPIQELFITATPHQEGSFLRMFADIQRIVAAADATIVRADVFGAPRLDDTGKRALRDVWGEVDWPLTWLVEGSSERVLLGGVTAYAVGGMNVQRIRLAGRVVGSIFDDGYARHCFLGDLWPSDQKAPPAVQARQTYEMIEAALCEVGMRFDHVARTWLYLDQILDWYGEFNQVRTQFYRERNIFDKLVPASTGIGSGNAAGAALVADACALESRHPDVKIFAVPSPLQCPALQYGSSFSRAVEVDMPDHRVLLVSGTASIEADGRTAHIGDIQGQIQRTMEVVQAILQSRGMDWRDVCRAVAYVKEAVYEPVFREMCIANGLQDLPLLVTENDICRDDLLFEIEVDAVTV